MNKRKYGFRGYIGSRAYDGISTPQHIQNQVIRDFCKTHQQTFLLSATEYAIPGCYIMLNTVVAELPKLNGMVMYSITMMPKNAAFRQRIYKAVQANAASLHFALENISAHASADFTALEDHITLNRVMEIPTVLKQP